jgi:hypothetical protein
MLDASWPPGFQNYWKAEYLAGLPDPAFDVLADGLARITSPLSDFKVGALGGAIARVGEDDTAYSYRGAPFVRTSTPDGASRRMPIRTWPGPRTCGRPCVPTRRGVYVNFMGDEGQDRVRAAYGDRKYGRLVRSRTDMTRQTSSG